MFNPVKSPDFVKLDTFLSKLVQEKQTPGVIFLLYEKETIKYLQKYGWQDIDSKSLEFDTIFRIYSMTKPIISIALMILYEKGKFELTDPISRYLPEFNNMRVFVKEEHGEIITEGLNRDITILDLFSHTSGLSYGLFENDPIDKLYNEKLAFEKTKSLLLENVVKIITSIPLRFQPGNHFRYSYGIDVLGRLIEVLSGDPLDEFLNKNVFIPLEMVDTAFYVPKEKKHKFAKLYEYSKENKLQLVSTASSTESYKKTHMFFSGGGGLVSTLGDYFNFALMLYNKGIFKEKRIISTETLDLITKNHLQNNETIPKLALNPFVVESMLKLEDYGQGLGLSVRIKKSEESGAIGDYGWGGAANTYFWIDPVNELFGIFMTQVTMGSLIVDRKRLRDCSYEGL